MYVIIVGGGTIGKTLATHLIGSGHEIVIIEEDPDAAKKLAESLDVIVVQGDGSATDILKDAGVDKADALVVLTPDDSINLTICQMAKKFNVPKIVARVNDPSKKDLYIDLEITAAISLVSAVVSHFKNTLSSEQGRSMVSIAGGNAEVLELKLTNQDLDGKKIKDIGLPNGAVIAAIYRNGEVIIASGDTILRKDDVLTLVIKTDIVQDATAILK